MFQRFGFLCVLAVAACLMAAPDSAFAGASAATFLDDLNIEITDWMTGTLGKFFAISALIISVGIAAFRQNFLILFGGLGVAAAAFFGPGAVSSVFTAIL